MPGDSHLTVMTRGSWCLKWRSRGVATAHSGSWQVVTGIGLMLIGAALQWANKAVLIGGQGHISRTSQTEASAALLSNCKQTHTHMHNPWTNSGICASPRQSEAEQNVWLFSATSFWRDTTPWLYLLRRWFDMSVWVHACVFASLHSCMPQMNHCVWKGKLQTCEGQTHQAQKPVRIEKHKSLHLSSRLRGAGLGLLTTEQWMDCCADNVMLISNAFLPFVCWHGPPRLLVTVWEAQAMSMPSPHDVLYEQMVRPGGSRGLSIHRNWRVGFVLALMGMMQFFHHYFVSEDNFDSLSLNAV